MALIRGNQMNTMTEQLQEGKVYFISFFKVQPSPKQYRHVDAPHILNFYYRTRIIEQPDTNSIRRNKFTFLRFEDKHTMVNDTTSCKGENNLYFKL